MKRMKGIDEVIEQMEQKLDQLQPHEQQVVLERLQKKYSHADQDVMVVGSNYDFWLNQKDDIYNKL